MPPSSTPSSNVSRPPIILCSEISHANGLLIHFRWPAGQRHPALLQTIKAVAMPQCARHVLLDDHDAGAVGADQRNSPVDLLDDDWRQTEADLIAQQDRRIRHQRAAD